MPVLFRITRAAVLVTALATGAAGSASAQRIGEIAFIGAVTIETGTRFAGTEIGGLSGLDYDAAKNQFVALSDDRGTIGPPRFYTLSIDLADGRLDDGDVSFLGVTELRTAAGEPFRPGSVDPEAIRVSHDGRLLYWTSEGDATLLLPPSVNGMTLDGRQMRSFDLPPAYVPNAAGTLGVRDNAAFESLTLGPDGRHLFTATETALVQDGPAPDPSTGSPARVLRYDLRTGKADAAFVYPVEPVPSDTNAPEAASSGTNGLVALLALGDTVFLALERAYVPGVGNTIRLFQTSSRGATDIHGRMSIRTLNVTPMAKTKLLDLAALGIRLDNVEGMSFGPPLPDGRPSLILVSDNNFNAGAQVTQFLAFAVSFVATDGP